MVEMSYGIIVIKTSFDKCDAPYQPELPTNESSYLLTGGRYLYFLQE